MNFNKHPLLDTKGNRIQSHGSSIFFFDGVFYWYGENKENITYNSLEDSSKCDSWHHGVKLYTSTDLINWEDKGFVIKESNDPNNPFYAKNIMDRPHVLYNKKNKQFVLWAKTSVKGNFGKCNFSICVGDSLQNMKYIKDIVPTPFAAGDFDMFIEDDKAFVIFASPKQGMIVYELSDDYMSLGNKYSEHIKFPYPPYEREAPCYFIHEGRRYILTSGTTGYFPNETVVYEITDLHGEWREVCKPCVDDKRGISYNLQFSSVLNVNGELIAIGDRWLYDFSKTAPNMADVFKGIYSKGKEKGITLTDEEYKSITKQDLSKAENVFLNIEFDNGVPVIRNKELI